MNAFTLYDRVFSVMYLSVNYPTLDPVRENQEVIDGGCYEEQGSDRIDRGVLGSDSDRHSHQLGSPVRVSGARPAPGSTCF